MQTNITPNSQLELITQDIPDPGPMIRNSNDLINEIDIEKNTNKRKAQTLFIETKRSSE